MTGVNHDIIWRRDRRMPKNPTSSGPLTDLPDYSFMDGRPTPLGVNEKHQLFIEMHLMTHSNQSLMNELNLFDWFLDETKV